MGGLESSSAYGEAAALQNKIKCLVSIGTGVPSLKIFRDDFLNIGETLVPIATETEKERSGKRGLGIQAALSAAILTRISRCSHPS